MKLTEEKIEKTFAEVLVQKSFLHSELWILTFGGAFQRAGVYKQDEEISESDKADFRNQLKKYVSENILPQYKKMVSEEDHIHNIQKIIKFSKQFKAILNNGAINFGVAQKLLNLLLKYHWCISEIVEPPHFPVDRIIQIKIGSKIENWTSINDIKKYKKIIEAARLKAKKQNMSLAMWELVSFNRNN